MSQYNGISYTLRRRTDSKYYFFDVQIRGKRIRKATKTTDKTVASAKAKKFINQIVEYQIPTNSSGIKEFEDRYYRTYEPRLAHRTIIAHRLALTHLLTYKPYKSLSEITMGEAEEFMTYLLTVKKMKPISVNTNVRMLRQLWTIAKRWDYVTTNIFSEVKLLNYQQKKAKVLTIDERKKLLSGFKELYPQHLDIIQFYLITGMRFSEPIEMEWENIHWDQSYIEPSKTKTKYNRQIPIFKLTLEILNRRKALDQERPFYLNRSWLRKCFKKVCKEKELQGVTFQSLRSTAYSYMVEMGVPQPIVRKIIGHTGDTIGQVHYFDLPIEQIISQTKGLQKIIGNSKARFRHGQ